MSLLVLRQSQKTTQGMRIDFVPDRNIRWNKTAWSRANWKKKTLRFEKFKLAFQRVNAREGKWKEWARGQANLSTEWLPWASQSWQNFENEPKLKHYTCPIVHWLTFRFLRPVRIFTANSGEDAAKLWYSAIWYNGYHLYNSALRNRF